MRTEFPALQPQLLAPIDQAKLETKAPSTHPPRILLLYGSLRERSFSRLLTQEAARILQALGCDVMEELVKFTLLTRDRADYLVDRYSERKANGRIAEHVELGAAAMNHETQKAETV